jgi:hypothetical protein
MPRWWKEEYDPGKHRNKMVTGYSESYEEDYRPNDNLKKRHVIFVEVARFTFIFFSLTELAVAITYFDKKVHPSQRIRMGGDSWEFQRWYERLPPGLNNSHNRPKVVKALHAAWRHFDKDAEYQPVVLTLVHLKTLAVHPDPRPL